MTTETNICYLTATEALRRFRTRELSPVELLNAQLARIERLEPTINALSAKRREEALEQAQIAERLYRTTPESAHLLEGITTLLKNEHGLSGLLTTSGSWLCDEKPDTENDPLVQRLLDAGAVIHGQTNVPEFYLAAFTRSERHGVTRNPWSPVVTCGGSSGGSAAALAAGYTSLATASDIGGSARIPAAYCGVVGLKPSYGRVPEPNFEFAMNPCNQNSVMARSVADCALMFNVVSGAHPVDPATVKPKLTLATEFDSVKGLRVALSHDLGYFRIADDVRRNTLRIADALRDAGAIVDEVVVPWDRSVIDAYTHHLGFLLGWPLAHGIRDHRDKVSDYVAAFADMAEHITPEMFFSAAETNTHMHESLQKILTRYDVLICPTLADTNSPAEGMADAHDDLMNRGLTYPFNLLGRHPVLAVPSGIAGNGVPTGVQIVGRTFDEPMVMRIGAAIERQLPWRYPDL